jgi:hypothetical protein
LYGISISGNAVCAMEVDNRARKKTPLKKIFLIIQRFKLKKLRIVKLLKPEQLTTNNLIREE